MKKIRRIMIFQYIMLGAFLILMNGCKKDSDNSIPTVSTYPTTEITQTSAISGGDITSEGGLSVTERGVCWSIEQNPTILDDKTIDGTGFGTFVSNISGLTANTLYYVRAYATNSLGTGYGNELTLTTPQAEEIVKDIDGNIYHAITIGRQVWMVENLKTTKYSNGDLIETTNPATFDISEETEPKYQWSYGGDINNANKYGRLYTWYAVTDSRNICPDGWHVPTDVEFTTLLNYFGGGDIAANQLVNANGFKALMSGYRYYTDHFLQIDTHALWWTSTEEDAEFAYKMQIEAGESSVVKSSFDKNYGLSVRCVKD